MHPPRYPPYHHFFWFLLFGATAFELTEAGELRITRAHITGERDTLDLLQTAWRLEAYAAIDTTLLPNYDLTSPTNTPIVVEDNAQVLEDSILAWQESPATQPALQEGLRQRYWPDGTAVEPSDNSEAPNCSIFWL